MLKGTSRGVRGCFLHPFPSKDDALAYPTPFESCAVLRAVDLRRAQPFLPQLQLSAKGLNGGKGAVGY